MNFLYEMRFQRVGPKKHASSEKKLLQLLENKFLFYKHTHTLFNKRKLISF